MNVAKHYAGPTWEAIDGSKVVGEVKASDDSSDAKGDPMAAPGRESRSGSGMLNRTTYVQRVNTIGGKAPADCGSSQAGAELRVPYEAKYNFYVAKP